MTFDKVKEIIVETLAVDEELVTPEATLFDDLGADSLDAVELNMALEDAFGVNIPDEDISAMKTVSDVVNYLESHQAAE